MVTPQIVYHTDSNGRVTATGVTRHRHETHTLCWHPPATTTTGGHVFLDDEDRPCGVHVETSHSFHVLAEHMFESTEHDRDLNRVDHTPRLYSGVSTVGLTEYRAVCRCGHFRSRWGAVKADAWDLFQAHLVAEGVAQ